MREEAHGGGSAMIAAPRVSVILTTYNRAAMVVEAIESVLRQSFRDLEIVVVDDGSTDDTADRIAALEGPIRYVRVPHGDRLGRLRNLGLQDARGTLIAWLDDDDAWEPEKLALQVALLDADPAVGLAYTGFSILEEDGKVHAPELAPWQKGTGPLLDRLLRGPLFLPSSVLVRRELVERVGGFDESRVHAEDYDLWLRLAPFTLGACIPQPLVRLRRGGPSRSTRDELLVYQTTVEILEDRLTAGAFDFRQRLRCRVAISNLHLRAAGIARTAGDARQVRAHTRAALRRNPFGRRGWAALRLSLRPPGTAKAP